MKRMHPIDSEKACPFVGQTLRELRSTVGNEATVLGFVGCPYTLATYLIEVSFTLRALVGCLLHGTRKAEDDPPNPPSFKSAVDSGKVVDTLLYSTADGFHKLQCVLVWFSSGSCCFPYPFLRNTCYVLYIFCFDFGRAAMAQRVTETTIESAGV